LHVQWLHDHVRNQRQDLLNKQAHYYTSRYDVIAIEDLRITTMVRHPNHNKSILDQGWDYFKQRLVAKPANAGRQLVLVNPAYTSQHSSSCDVPFPDFDLVRTITCRRCGLTLACNHNTALNILQLTTTGRDSTVRCNEDAS
jgi:putative transposase